MSRGLGRRTRAARFSAPVTADRVRSAILRSISATTFATTIRAVAFVVSGMIALSDSSVPTRCTSGSTLSSISFSSSSCRRFSRSMASRCITCTTVDGKYVRMSPSHRATRGADAPSPPRPPAPAAPPPARAAAAAPTVTGPAVVVQRAERAVDRGVLTGSAAAPSAGAAGEPSSSRHRRSRSASSAPRPVPAAIAEFSVTADSSAPPAQMPATVRSRARRASPGRKDQQRRARRPLPAPQATPPDRQARPLPAPSAARRAPARRARSPPAPGRLNPPNVRRSSGSTSRNSVRASDATHSSSTPSSSLSCTSSSPLPAEPAPSPSGPAEEPLRPGRLRRGAAPRPTAPRGTDAAAPRQVSAPASASIRVTRPGDQPVHVPPPGKPAQRVDPPLRAGTNPSPGGCPYTASAACSPSIAARSRAAASSASPPAAAGQPGADPDHQRVDHGGQRPGRRAAHGPVPDGPHQRRDRGHQRHHVLVGRRDRVERAQHRRERRLRTARRAARRTPPPSPRAARTPTTPGRSAGRRTPRRTEVPQTAASITATDSDGCQRSVHVSRKVPVDLHRGLRERAEADAKRVKLVQELRPSPVQVARAGPGRA